MWKELLTRVRSTSRPPSVTLPPPQRPHGRPIATLTSLLDRSNTWYNSTLQGVATGHPVAPAQFAQINLAADFGVVPPGYGQFEETDDVNCDEQGEISFCWFIVLKGFQFYWTYYRSARRSPGCQLFIHGDFSPNCSNSFRKAQPATLNFKLRSQVTVEVIAFTQKL